MKIAANMPILCMMAVVLVGCVSPSKEHVHFLSARTASTTTNDAIQLACQACYACINNMMRWAEKNQVSDDDPVDTNAVCMFLDGLCLPQCPTAGRYSFGKIGDRAGATLTCSIHGSLDAPHLPDGSHPSVVTNVFDEGEKYIQASDGWIHGPYRFEAGEMVCGGTVVNPSRRKFEVQQRLQHTMIPRIDFSDTDIRYVAEFFQTASRRNSPQGLPAGDIRINIDLADYVCFRHVVDEFNPTPVVLCPPPRITFNAHFVSYLDALKIIAEVTDMVCYFGEDFVNMTPKYKCNAQQVDPFVPSEAMSNAARQETGLPSIQTP